VNTADVLAFPLAPPISNEDRLDAIAYSERIANLVKPPYTREDLEVFLVLAYLQGMTNARRCK
jgi:hypothetical protein